MCDSQRNAKKRRHPYTQLKHSRPNALLISHDPILRVFVFVSLEFIGVVKGLPAVLSAFSEAYLKSFRNDRLLPFNITNGAAWWSIPRKLKLEGELRRRVGKKN